MQYRNNVRYEGIYGGVAVTFTLANFSQKVVEKFNEALAKEVTKNVAEARQSNVAYS
jgi:hypothetical protein